jgi:hypothetical protein
MSSEQPWSSTPSDPADSQQQYSDPYQTQPYSSYGVGGGAVPRDSAPGAQGHAAADAGTGYGYAGYGEAYGYGGGYGDGNGYGDNGYAGTGYGEYGQYQQYGQYEQYDPLGQSYGRQQEQEQYAQPQSYEQSQPYTQAQAYEQLPSYAEPQPYAESQSYEQQPYGGQQQWSYGAPSYEQQSYQQQSYEAPPAPQPAADGYAADGYGTDEPEGLDEDDASYPRSEVRERFETYAERLESPEPAARRERDGGGAQVPGKGPKPKKKSRRLVAVVVILVLVGGVAAAYKVLGGSKSDDTEGAAAASGSTKANGAVAGGAAAVSGSASAAASPSPTPAASVTLPSTAGGLTQMTNKVGQAGVSAMEKAAKGNVDLVNAQFAEYEKTGSSTFFGNLTLAQLTKASDIQKTYALTGATATLATLGASSLTSEQTVTPDVPGAAMACGRFTTGGNTMSLCIWVDPSEFGLFAGPKALSDSQAEQYAEAMEAASEH